VARLIITSPDGKRGMYELAKPVVTVGRGAANDLVLNDTSVSRFHAVIKRADENQFVVGDRGSKNGVTVNGDRVDSERVLQNGDIIRMGAYSLAFEVVAEEPVIVMGKADIPSELDQMLRGGVQPSRVHSVVDPNSQSGLLESIRRLEQENYLLKVLFDAGKSLHSKLSIDDITTQVTELVFRISGVERGFLMLFDEEGNVSHQSEVKYRIPPEADEVRQPSIILSSSVMNQIKKDPQPILITDVGSDERFRGSQSLMLQGLRSAMCAPLVGMHRLLGILYVDNLNLPAAFTQEELNVFALVAAQAASAIDNALASRQISQGALQRAALERFLSPEVVEMVAADPEGVGLGGVNQKVTIFFADIRGFTSLSERMQPEKIVELLNEYFTRTTDVIFDHNGTLDKYIGDAIMALFGAPISKGNDAANAVQAAIDLQRLLVEINRDAAARGFPEINVGIGINTGVVTAGNIGSPKRLDYTVIGDAVNTASRLMSHAAPGQILISQSTLSEVGGNIPLTELPPLLVKGKSMPLKVYNVDWARTEAASS
jgi:adenylate cyclase